MRDPEIFDLVGYLSQGMTIDERGNVVPEKSHEEEDTNMTKTNAYFEEMERIDREYWNKRDEHNALKQQIRETYGIDSEEMDAWYKEDYKLKEAVPFTMGEYKALRAWDNSEGAVIMKEFTWDKERHDFIETLRKAGVETFVTTNQSTGLMEDMHGYVAEGCTMLGLCTVTERSRRWGEEEEETIMGVRFKL